MSVFCSGRKQVVVLHTTYVLWSTIKLWCCVSFFRSGGKQFLVFRTYGTHCKVGFTQNRDTVAQVQKKVCRMYQVITQAHSHQGLFVLAGDSFWCFIHMVLIVQWASPKTGTPQPRYKKKIMQNVPSTYVGTLPPRPPPTNHKQQTGEPWPKLAEFATMTSHSFLGQITCLRCRNPSRASAPATH